MLATATNALIGILVALYTIVGDLGLTIIIFGVLVRLLLFPLSLPTIRSAKKMRTLQPEIKALKAKHKDDKQAFATAQMELYKKYNVNPLAGCLPQIIQIALLFFLYHAFSTFLRQETINGVLINPSFLWLDLRLPDSFFIIPVLAGISQLVLSLMIAPGGEVADVVPNNSKNKKIKAKNEKEEDVADMAATMQQQMIFMMPVVTGIAALQFPSGLGLYWVATTVISIAQQYAVSGPGGLVTYSQRAAAWIKQRVGR